MPYILAALVALLITGFGGYRYGKHVCKGEQATVVADAQKQAITDANAATEAATKLAVEQAKMEAAQRLAATTIRLKGERDAALKARPDCIRDMESQRLLQCAIDSANGQTSTGDCMPDPLHANKLPR